MKTKHTNPSQEEQIRRYLCSGKKLTAIDALNRFNCFRLAARIASLRKRGYRIKSVMKTNKQGKRFACYFFPLLQKAK
jgi:hypothetical protein